MDWYEGKSNGHHRITRPEGRPSLSEIVHELIVGEYPRDSDVEWLKHEHGVTAVHNLQDNEDLRANGLDIEALRKKYEEHGIKFVRTPIQDGSSDEMAARLKVALDDLHDLVGSNERVYLHCNAGLNRAPTLAIAYLRAHRGMSLNEALAHVKARRACGPFMTVLEDHFGPRDQKPGK